MSNRSHHRTNARRALRFVATISLGWMLCTNPSAASDSASTLSSEQFATFKRWQISIKPDLIENGLSETFTNERLKAIKPDAKALHEAERIATSRIDTSTFMKNVTSRQRITKGRQELTSPTLAQIEKSHGVPRSVLLAIANARDANVEHNIIEALATLSALDQRRPHIWYREFVAALRIAESRAIPTKLMRGSATGNAGATHVLPTFLEAFADDEPSATDNSRSKWHDTSKEAFTTTASALRQLGWRAVPAGVSWWGYEVALPPDLDFRDVGLSYDHPGAVWQSRGVKRIPSGLIPPDTRFSLIAPQGARGPAFLVTHNIRVLRRLHDETSPAPDRTTFALAIARLAHRIMGGAPLTGAWRTVKPLTRSERMRIQERLVARGYDTGGIDGILGRKSAVAIRAEQRKHDLPQDGFVDRAIMRLLQHSGLPHVGETE